MPCSAILRTGGLLWSGLLRPLFDEPVFATDDRCQEGLDHPQFWLELLVQGLAVGEVTSFLQPHGFAPQADDMPGEDLFAGVFGDGFGEEFLTALLALLAAFRDAGMEGLQLLGEVGLRGVLAGKRDSRP